MAREAVLSRRCDLQYTLKPRTEMVYEVPIKSATRRGWPLNGRNPVSLETVSIVNSDHG